MRKSCVLFALVVAASACGRSRDEAPRAGSAQPRRDAAAAADAVEIADASLTSWLDSLEPKASPHPPLTKHTRGDCRTEYAPRPTRDPNPMCKVDGGTFAFGEEGRRVAVGPYFIDQFEVSSAQAALFLNARGNNECPGMDRRPAEVGINPCVLEVGFDDSAIIQREGRFEVGPGLERTSVMSFSWQGALEYCAWVGKQVPSSAQWELAARHDPRTGKDLVYPWGDRWKPKHASCWLSSECNAPPEPKRGRSIIGLFDGASGLGDGSSPWGLHDTVAGSSELVFACGDPEATCRIDESCNCVAQHTPSDALTTAELRLTARATQHGMGSQGLRCARR